MGEQMGGREAKGCGGWGGAHVLVLLYARAVEQKCRDIQRQAEDAVMALEQELQVQLMKIPRKVRRTGNTCRCGELLP